MNKAVEALARDFHGSLAALHLFAAWFNLKRGRFGFAIFHVAAAIVSVVCSRVHARDAR